MNKKIALMSLFVASGTHCINAEKSEIIQYIDSSFKISGNICEKMSRPFLENNFINNNKVLKMLMWSGLGSLFGYLSYRTMYDIYHEKTTPLSRYPILGDKILMTIICSIFAGENALELYKSYNP